MIEIELILVFEEVIEKLKKLYLLLGVGVILVDMYKDINIEIKIVMVNNFLIINKDML